MDSGQNADQDPVATIERIAVAWASDRNLTEEEQEERRQSGWHRPTSTEREAALGTVVSALRSLTPGLAGEIGRWALRRYDAVPNSHAWTRLLGVLANYVDGGLLSIYPELLGRDLLNPPWMYRGADPATRDTLIRRIEDLAAQAAPPHTRPFNGLLLCLAWIGDETVQALFASWRAQPPNWRTELYIPPERYAESAGWELTPTGTMRRDLFLAPAYELVPMRGEAPEETGLVVVPAPAERVEATCGWCGRDLYVLFDFDLRDPRFAVLGLDGTRLRIALCPFCSYFAPVVTDVDYAGRVAWSAENGARPAILDKIPDGGPDDTMPPFEHGLRLGQRRGTPYEAVGTEMGGMSESQLGGLPDWIQDAEYPVCPGCQRRMRYVGQVAMDDIIPDHEGITYAFLCAECGKAATTYQQT